MKLILLLGHILVDCDKSKYIHNRLNFECDKRITLCDMKRFQSMIRIPIFSNEHQIDMARVDHHNQKWIIVSFWEERLS